MSEKALVVREEMALADTIKLGETLAQSGYFSDARQAAQAVVKVLAGRELGFGPIASMTGIYIVNQRVALSANLMAAAIKRDPRYDYKVAKHDAELCSIVFFENGEIVGTSTFTMEDAKRAGLSGTNWTKYPRNMLFARAMSNGAKWYCPDAFGGGPVYTPEELGVSEIIDVTPEHAATIDDAAELAEAKREGDAIAAAQELGFEGITGNAPVQAETRPHWIDCVTKDGRNIRNAFWQWARETMALSGEQVYAALGVEHIHDYTGTMEEAKAQIEAWVKEQADKEAEPA